MSASLTWRTTSLDEILMAIHFCVERNGLAHVYLHGPKWVVCSTLHNDTADDHVIDVNRMTSQKKLEQTLLRTMLVEVS